MPSRRRYLAAVGSTGLAVGGLAGCLAEDRGNTGYVWRKGVRVEAVRGEQFVATSVLDLTMDSDERVLRAEYDPGYVSVGESHTTVSPATDDALEDAFDDYWYYVNVDTGDGDPANGATARADFNRVTVGADATASTGETPHRRDWVSVRAASSRTAPPADVTRYEFDVRERLDSYR